MKKKSSRRRTTATHRTSLWLACLSFDRPTKWSGTCQVVVRAKDPDDAMRKCHEKLERVADSTDLFPPGTKVFADGIIRLPETLDDGVLVNFDTSNGPARVFNLLPDADDGGAECFTMAEKPGTEIEPFIEIYGEDNGDAESGSRLLS